jgi:hypothetical protein
MECANSAVKGPPGRPLLLTVIWIRIEECCRCIPEATLALLANRSVARCISFAERRRIMSKEFRKTRPDDEATDDEFAKAIGIALREVTEEPAPEVDEPDDDTLDDDEDEEPDDDEMSAIADSWIFLHRIS